MSGARCTSALEIPMPATEGHTGEITVMQCVKAPGHTGSHKTDGNPLLWTESTR